MLQLEEPAPIVQIEQLQKSFVNRYGLTFRYFAKWETENEQVVPQMQKIVIFYQCTLCHKIYASKSTMLYHDCRTHIEKSDNFEFNPNKAFEDLLILIIVHDISVNAIASPEAKRLFDDFGRKNFVIPSQKTIRNRIISYADSIMKSTYINLSGHIVSLLIDSAKRVGKFYEGFIIYTKERLYYYPFSVIPKNTSVNEAGAIANAINFLESLNITVISVCTDNGSTNIGAFNKSKHNYAVQYQIGTGIIRIPCCCHVTENALKDVFEKTDAGVIKVILELLKFPPDGMNTTEKFSNSRWSSIYDCIVFILNHQEFYAYNKNTKALFQSIEITYKWSDLYMVTKILWDLIKRLEQDMSSICEVFIYLNQALTSLSSKNTPLRQRAYTALFNRFMMCDGLCLPCAAFLLTPFGRLSFKSSSEEIQARVIKCSKKGIKMYASDRLIYDFNQMKNIFIAYIEQDNSPLDGYTGNIEELYYNLMKNEKDTTICHFYRLAFEIVQIPCSEAPVERLFAHIERFLAPQSHNIAPDLLNAKAIIKMNYIFTQKKQLSPDFTKFKDDIDRAITNIDETKRNKLAIL